jgi:predicted adenylyl cyclase CyaB
VSRNIELKARLTDPASARSIAERLCGPPAAVLRQTDTYFHCALGRLKLRETDGSAAELIAYQRPDAPNSKVSEYLITDVPNPDRFCQTLGAALGIRAVVRKTRRLYLYQNVRIHLDDVDHLGSFLEFEVVLGDQSNDSAGHRQTEELCRAFGIVSDDLLAGSYGDMLATPGA